jgi:hypothetical protein
LHSGLATAFAYFVFPYCNFNTQLYICIIISSIGIIGYAIVNRIKQKEQNYTINNTNISQT